MRMAAQLSREQNIDKQHCKQKGQMSAFFKCPLSYTF